MVKPVLKRFAYVVLLLTTSTKIGLVKKLVTSKFVLVTVVALSFTIPFYSFVIKDLPSPQNLLTRDQAVSTKIYDRHGNLLFKIYKNENRSLISLEDLPLHLIQATIAIEDSDFYQHNGFSVKGIIRALKRNIVDDRSEGGSTITQQLVKNALLTPEKTYTRKLKEVILAIRVELEFEKDDILQMYFNEVGYGGAAYGIEEAAQLYFGKSAQDVDLAEAALLAGLPVAPTTYSPFGISPELAISRQHQVLDRMVAEKYISPQQAQQAKTEKLVFNQQKIDITAPHFVMYIKDLLVKKYGEALVHQGGLEVITSLDLDTQQITEQAIDRELQKLKNLNVTNAAAMVTNPQTGEILAMVGSNNYFDTENDGQVNVTLRPRQPGSSIKPINYAVALESGFTPATIIDDSPVVFRIPGTTPYAPKNYDGRFHGKVTLRSALANSYNVPAVKTLSQFGVDKMISKGQDMGITTWNDPSRFGLSLTLGGGEITMFDMTTVYGTLANQGVRVDLNPILRITDHQGTVYQQFACDRAHLSFSQQVQAKETSNCRGEQVVDPIVAYQLTDILSDNTARAPAFGTHSVLNIPNHQVAVKTGTTNDLRDNWTFGYTADTLVAVWVGNNDNQPMSYIASGITGASPIWNSIMSQLLDNKPSHSFTPPTNLITVNICQLTGTKACSACPNNQPELFIPGTEPSTACSEAQIEAMRNPKPNTPESTNRLLEGITTN